ncbi:mucin-binding protein, partial [Streptococcus danieliae]|uniref:mucin-binding protein n=1 Tax=Streptococcus danieliae TaxID=747656 RepID=UPI0021C62AFF
MKKHLFDRSVQRFSIRKYSFGAASVLLGTLLFAGQSVQAEEAAASESSESNTSASTGSSSDATPEAASDASTYNAEPAVLASEAPVVAPASSETSTASSEVATSNPSESSSSSTTVEDDTATTTAATNVEEEKEKKADESKEVEVAKPAATVRTSAFRAATAPEAATVVTNWDQFVSALSNANVTDIKVQGQIFAPNTVNGITNGNDSSEAANAKTKAVDRTLSLAIANRAINIYGDGANSGIDFRSYSIKPIAGAVGDILFSNLSIYSANSKGPIDLSRASASKVTFEDVKSEGVMFGGGRNTTVVIKGNTTSNLADSYASLAGGTQYVQMNVPHNGLYAEGETNENKKQPRAAKQLTRRAANIHSVKNVIVESDATFTLNRVSEGDGISLPSNSVVEVKDKGSMTINMNTSSDTSNPARYHNAAIFMPQNGTVKTGKESKLAINSSIGQAISIGVRRPGDTVTDANRYGGYGVRNATKVIGSSATISIGEEATATFTGRDSIITGHNATFTSGEKSKVDFKNKGRGVAMDLGDNSHILFGKHSNNVFESDGKAPYNGNGAASGSYDGYNYIGVNEQGTITVDDHARFIVVAKNRNGSQKIGNEYDDLISLDSQKGTATKPLFIANQGSITDIRDDNNNFYAELISVPLGATKNVVFRIDTPLYFSLQRYSTPEGQQIGDPNGKLPNSTPQGFNPPPSGTPNLVYGNTKGTKMEFVIDNSLGIDSYTVYARNEGTHRAPLQKDPSKQNSVWANIKQGDIALDGFGGPVTIAGSDPSIRLANSPGGILPVEPNTSNDRSYDIDVATQNSHSVWVPNGTKINPLAKHTNTVEYYVKQADGSLVPLSQFVAGEKDSVTERSDWERKMDIVLDVEAMKQKFANTVIDSGNTFLREYAKIPYSPKADTGWTLTANSETKNTYSTINKSLSGYVATITESNVPNLQNLVGQRGQGESVHAVLDSSAITDTILTDSNGKKVVSESYWKDFNDTGFPENYLTKVVFELTDTAKVVYRNTANPANPVVLSDSGSLDGAAGESVPYTADQVRAKLEEYKKAGYELVTDGYTGYTYNEATKSFERTGTTVPTFDGVNGEQVFNVDLKPRVVPITPEKPVDPSKPVDPTDPTSPNYPNPDNPEALKLTEDVKRTVRYVDQNGNVVSPEVVDNLGFKREGTINLVTGETTLGDWTPTAGDNFENKKSPVVKGFVLVDPSQADAGSHMGVKATDPDYVDTVTYKPISRYVPEFPEGSTPTNPWTEVPYVNDPTDPSKIVPPTDETQRIPYIEGMVPTNPADGSPLQPVDSNDPTKGYIPPAPTDSGVETKIPYKSVADQAQVIYRVVSADGKTVVNPEVATSGLLDGTAGAEITYSTTAALKDLYLKGYKLSENSTVEGNKYRSGLTFDGQNGVDTYYVDVTPIIVPVTPTTPVTPDQPVDPNKVPELPKNPDPTDPSTPNYPQDPDPTKPKDPNKPSLSNPEVLNLTEDVKRTVKYVDESGKELSPDVVNTLGFTRTGTVNLATGETTLDEWVATDGNDFKDATSPVIPGYVLKDPGQKEAGAHTGVQATDEDLEDRVVYVPISKYVPSFPGVPEEDKPNNPWNEVPYKEDPTDPTKLVPPTDPTQVIPYIPEFEPTIPLQPVDPTDPTKGYIPPSPTDPTTVTEIPFARIDAAVVIYNYVDQDGKTLIKELERSAEFKGKKDEAIGTNGVAYTTAETIAKYKKLGYELVNDGFPVGATFDGTKGTDTYYVSFKAKVAPVTPDKPVDPNNPVDPNDPDSPNYPDPTDPDSKDPSKMLKDVTRVIQYLEQGTETVLSGEVSDKVSFRREGVVNLVTGEVVWNQEGWQPATAEFTNRTSPAIPGYHLVDASQSEYGAHTGITNASENIVDKVYYAKNPDPDKIAVQLVYREVKEDGTTVVKQLEASDQMTGNQGDDVPYTQDQVNEIVAKYHAQGYKLVKNGYPTGAKFDGEPGSVTNYFVDLAPIIIPITPEKPVDPNKPVDPKTPGYPDPEDPNPPVYPTPDKEEALKLAEEVKRTIRYVDQDGKVVAAEVVDSLNFRREGTINLVTGETTLGEWTAVSGNGFDDKTSPVVTGYVLANPDQKEAGAHTGVQATDEDYLDVVAYKPISRYVPKFPDGSTPTDPWTEVPYVNDPTNPSKVVPPTDETQRIPYVEGFVPTNPTDGSPLQPVDPNDPSKGYIPPAPTDPGVETTIPYVEVDQPVDPDAKDDQAQVVYRVVSADGTSVVNEQIATSGILNGKEGARITYSTAATLKDLYLKGYTLSSNSTVAGEKYRAGLTFDGKEGVDTYYVDVTAIVVPVTPEKPVEPNKPVDPETPELPKNPDPTDPTTPNYPDPDKTDILKLEDEVVRTVRYYIRGRDGQLTEMTAEQAAMKSDTLRFRREGTINLATGETTLQNWVALDGSAFGAYTSPSVPGYVLENASQLQAGAHNGISADSADIHDQVIYVPVGNYVPKFPDGSTPTDPWSEVPYVADPSKPTDIVPPTDPKQPAIPYVPGLTPVDPETNEPLKPVNPDNPGQGYIPPVPTSPTTDTEIPYVKNPTPEVKEDQARVIYRVVDESGAVVNPSLRDSGLIVGREGEEIKYSTAPTLKELYLEGYTLVKDGFTAGAKYDGQDGVDLYYVDVKAIVIPVTPEKPVEPSKPVDPETPELPKNPDPTDPTTPNYPDPEKPKDPNVEPSTDIFKLEEEVVRTVRYYVRGENGQLTELPASLVAMKSDTLRFRREGTVNLATGATTLQNWVAVDGSAFGAYTSPSLPGYILENASQRQAGAHNGISADSADIHDQVVYLEVGNYVPEFPPGVTPEKPWTEVPYVTDPNKPTDIVPPTDPKQPAIPYVPGLTPVDPGTKEPLKPVDPQDPTKGYIPPVPTTPTDETKIPYIKNVVEDKAQIIYRLVDEAGKVVNAELAKSDVINGEEGQEIQYSTAATLKELYLKGYTLVKDGFVPGTKFDG